MKLGIIHTCIGSGTAWNDATSDSKFAGNWLVAWDGPHRGEKICNPNFVLKLLKMRVWCKDIIDWKRYAPIMRVSSISEWFVEPCETHRDGGLGMLDSFWSRFFWVFWVNVCILFSTLVNVRLMCERELAFYWFLLSTRREESTFLKGLTHAMSCSKMLLTFWVVSNQSMNECMKLWINRMRLSNLINHFKTSKIFKHEATPRQTMNFYAGAIKKTLNWNISKNGWIQW